MKNLAVAGVVVVAVVGALMWSNSGTSGGGSSTYSSYSTYAATPTPDYEEVAVEAAHRGIDAGTEAWKEHQERPRIPMEEPRSNWISRLFRSLHL